MSIAAPILHVKADPRGRVAIGKAIETLSGLLSTHITGFDVILNEDSTLVLRPTTEVPAQCVMTLSAKAWDQVHAAIEHPPKPTAGLRKLVAATAGDRSRRR